MTIIRIHSMRKSQAKPGNKAGNNGPGNLKYRTMIQGGIRLEWQGVRSPCGRGRRRGGAGAVVYKGKIYLACGIKDGHRGDHKKWLDAYEHQWSVPTTLKVDHSGWRP